MAETKADRAESWKKTTSAHAAALRKAKATVYHPSTGKSGRTIPLTAQTPEEVEAITAGAAKDISGKPTALINQLYMGPGTGPGITVSPIVTHTQRVTGQESAQRIADIQQQQFEERLRSPIQTGIGSPLHKVAEPVIKEYEAGISTKPTTTDKPPEYVPTPYKPGTQPGDVEYGERPTFEQPQIHDIIGTKLRKLDTYLGEKRVGVDIAVRQHIPDISAEKFTDLVSRGFFLVGAGSPGMGTLALYSGIPPTPGQIAAGEFLHERYTGFQETPLTTVRDIGTDAAVLLVSGGVLSAGLKVGIIGARLATAYGAGKVAAKIPSVPVVLGTRSAKIHTQLEKAWSGRVLKDPEKFDIGKFASGAIQTTPGLIEPAVALGFTVHTYQDIMSTPKQKIPRKLYEYGVGFVGATKGFKAPEKFIGWWSTKGRKEIPIETVVEPAVLTGKRYLPNLKKGESFEEYALRFQYERLPSETAPKIITKEMMKAPMEEQIHYRGFRAVSEVSRDLESISPTQKQFPIKQRHETDLPVTYVSADTLSPYFLMLGGKSPSSGFTFKSLLGTTQSPFAKAYRIEAKGVRRLPKEVRKDVSKAQKFMEKQAEPGFFYTTKALERKFAGASGGKKEIEAGLTGETLYKTTGEALYITHKGVRVPLNEINARINQQRAKINQEIVTTKGKYIKESGLKSYDLLTSASKYVPPTHPSEYVLPSTEKKYAPSTKKKYVPPPHLSEYYAPIQPSEYYTPIQPSEYYAPIQPSEYYAPTQPSEYVPPPLHTTYVPPPPKTPKTPRLDLDTKPTKPVGRVRKETPGYAWQLANPIASLEQLLSGRRTKKTRKKTTKSKRRSKQ